MHDRNNKPLKVGDIVLVPCKIVETQATEDYCNCTLESVYGRRPDRMKEKIHAINTGILLRANAGDHAEELVNTIVHLSEITN